MMSNKKFPESYYTRVIKELLAQKKLLKETGNPELVLEDTLKMLSQLLHLNRGRIFLWNDFSQQLQIKYSYNLSDIEKCKGKYEVCEGITGDVFDTGKSALIPDISAVANYQGKVTPRALLQETPIAYIAVPIMHNNSTLGVLAVDSILHYDGDLEANAIVLKLVAEMLGKVIDKYDLCEYASYAA